MTRRARPVPPEVAAYLSRLRLAGHSDSTVRARRLILGAFLLALGGRGVLEATRFDVEGFVGRPELRPASRRAYRSGLRSFYAWAVEEALLSVDPTARVPAVKVPRNLPRPLAPGDLERVVVHAEPRMRAWVLLMALAGLRCLEVAALRPVDLSDGPNGPVLHLPVVKGGGTGSVPAHPTVVEALSTLPIYNGLWWDCSAKYVSRTVGEHLRDQGVQATAHALRHTAATLYYRHSGHDLLTTARLLRHASVTSTQVYAQLDQERPAEVVNAVPLRLVAG